MRLQTALNAILRKRHFSQVHMLLGLILLIGSLQLLNTYTDFTYSKIKARNTRMAGRQLLRQHEHMRSYSNSSEFRPRKEVVNFKDALTLSEKSERRGAARQGRANRSIIKPVRRNNCNDCSASLKNRADIRVEDVKLKDLTRNELIALKASTSAESDADRRNVTCNGCSKYAFDYIIMGKHICEGNSKIDLIFLITTAHSHSKRRTILRKTWLTYVKNSPNLRYVFLLGQTLDKDLSNLVKCESNVHRDIIMEDFVDTYLNLTLKTIMALRWVTEYCPRVRFIMKTDDDIIVNVPGLVTLLQSRFITGKLENSIMGSCVYSKPERNKASKYYASWQSYPYDSYPPICFGTGYVMSMRTANKIYNISQSVPFFHLEDVYIGFCLQQIGISTFNYEGFSLDMQTARVSCRYRRSKCISVHALNGKNLAKLWSTSFGAIKPF